jgi:RNA polymerase sigma-70 factor (sigma-E family)
MDAHYPKWPEKSPNATAMTHLSRFDASYEVTGKHAFDDGGAVDDQDFEQFATARAPELYRAAWLLCGNQWAAEDLVQETFARAYSRWHHVSTADNPAAYVQTVLFRMFVTGRRRLSSTETPTAELPESRAGTRDHDLRLTLAAALDELPRTDRAVLVMRYLLDHTVASAARELGLTENAVRSRASRALSRVREQLGADFIVTTGEQS